MPNTWERLGINQKTLDQCDNIAISGSSYWFNSLHFLKSIKNTKYSDLTVDQRNWARDIVRKLKNKEMS